MARPKKHIVIDARIRRSSTGRPVDRLLEYIQDVESDYKYTVLLQKDDDWKPRRKSITVEHVRYKTFTVNPVQHIMFSLLLYRKKADLVYFTLTPSQPLFFFGAYATFTHDLQMLQFNRRGKLPRVLHALRMQGYKLLLWQAHKFAKHI